VLTAIEEEPMGFYDRLKEDRGDDDELAACIKNTTTKLQEQATDRQRPGMLLGKIQAGKTRAFLGIIALAFDEGYDVAIVLTKGTKTLARQTVSRVSGDFGAFQKEDTIDIYDIMAVPALTEWEVDEHKLIFVVKKQYRNLERLMTLFCKTQPLLQHKKVLIIDDEADFASIRFTKKKGEEESDVIAAQIDRLTRSLFDFAKSHCSSSSPREQSGKASTREARDALISCSDWAEERTRRLGCGRGAMGRTMLKPWRMRPTQCGSGAPRPCRCPRRAAA
jgi:hypothetical protein